MEIRHASLLQVRAGRDGKRVLVENDVLDVVRQLKEISPSLSVNWNEYGHYFSVVETCDDGRERLVTTVTELTPALVEYVRKIAKQDVAKEVERLDAEADRAKDHRFREKVGESGERLFHALRKDRQAKSSIYVP